MLIEFTFTSSILKQGSKTTLNSSLPFGQVALMFYLPRATTYWSQLMILLELVAQQENLPIPGDHWGFSWALQRAKKFMYWEKWSPRKKSNNIAHDAHSEKKKNFSKTES